MRGYSGRGRGAVFFMAWRGLVSVAAKGYHAAPPSGKPEMAARRAGPIASGAASFGHAGENGSAGRSPGAAFADWWE